MWHSYILTQSSSSIRHFRWNYSGYIKQANNSGWGSRCYICSCFNAQTARKYYQHGIFLNIAESIQPLSFALRSVRLQTAETVLHSLFQFFFTLKQLKWQYQRKWHTEDRWKQGCQGALPSSTIPRKVWEPPVSSRIWCAVGAWVWFCYF